MNKHLPFGLFLFTCISILEYALYKTDQYFSKLDAGNVLWAGVSIMLFFLAMFFAMGRSFKHWLDYCMEKDRLEDRAEERKQIYK
ncbi:MAG: hypothetical protein J0L94_10790 [Rhodothermia bacterium]|nr:hypothetical protein [Rhodothermia bacterium]